MALTIIDGFAGTEVIKLLGLGFMTRLGSTIYIRRRLWLFCKGLSLRYFLTYNLYLHETYVSSRSRVDLPIF